jgi:hypothetical protein
MSVSAIVWLILKIWAAVAFIGIPIMIIGILYFVIGIVVTWRRPMRYWVPPGR